MLGFGSMDAADDQGVDRSQVRAMLKLSPAERVARLEEMIASILLIRELNANPQTALPSRVSRCFDDGNLSDPLGLPERSDRSP